MALPGISCYCSTYGRPTRLLENSIASFLEQDYPGPKELVILNDFSEQELVFKHPQVRIINLKDRIKPLGKKFNINIDYCQYDLLATWEDDDVFLKNRLSTSYQRMQNGVFHTHDAFYEKEEHQLVKIQNIFHSTHMFDRKLFHKIGGYNSVDDVCSIDVEFMDAIRLQIGEYTQDLPLDQIFYIYVWAGAQSYHGSGWGAQKTDISDGAAAVVATQISKGQIKLGRVDLVPKLRYDFYKYLPKL
jgi:hypothetical protein